MRTKTIIAAVISLAAAWLVAPAAASALPVATVTPSSFDFYNVSVSGTPDYDFTVINTGDSPLAVSGTSLVGMNPDQFSITRDDCSGMSIAPSTGCVVTVAFAPTVIGPASAKLSISSNGSDGPIFVDLSGVGSPYDYPVMDPEELAFGQARINTGPSAPKTWKLTAAGATPMTIEEISFYFSPLDFTILSQNCVGRTLNIGDSCNLSVDFQPGGLGYRSATLLIRTDDSVWMPRLSGIGVNPAFTLTPSTHDFGTLTTNDGAGTSTRFTLASTGTTNLEVGTASLTGAAASQFGITADACSNKSIPPGSSCDISVAFSPTTAGEKSAGLSLPLNAGIGPATAQLTGFGQDRVPPPDPCHPVAVKKIKYFTPTVKKASDVPGLRARITTDSPALVRVSSEVAYHGRGYAGVIQYGQRKFHTGSRKSINYKVTIPERLRGKLVLGKKVRFEITYASKSTKPSCTEFGESSTRGLTTRVVRVTPND